MGETIRLLEMSADRLVVPQYDVSITNLKALFVVFLYKPLRLRNVRSLNQF